MAMATCVATSKVNLKLYILKEEKIQTYDADCESITGLDGPSGVAIFDNQNVIVSEAGTNRITTLRDGERFQSFGSQGRNDGELDAPHGMAITSIGSVLVADRGNNRIQEFCSDIYTGSYAKKLFFPHGIAINKSTGEIFVADTYEHYIQVFSYDLKLLYKIGNGFGSEDGYFDCPHDVVIDNAGQYVYVTDCNNHRVQKFTVKGQFVSSFGRKGSDPGQLFHPSGIAMDVYGMLHVNNAGNNYVTTYNKTDSKCPIVYDSLYVGNRSPSDFFHGIAIDKYRKWIVCCPGDNKIINYQT